MARRETLTHAERRQLTDLVRARGIAGTIDELKIAPNTLQRALAGVNLLNSSTVALLRMKLVNIG